MAGVSSTTCSCSIIDTKHSASVLKSPVGAAALLLADSGASASSPPPRELSASPLSPSSCEETSSPRCLSPPCAAASLGELVTPIHNQCVRDAMQRITLQDEAEACFYVCDLRVLARQMSQWRALMPRVEPFYAVKCNSEPRVLQTLAQLDISGFDCASRAEMEAVLSMGVSPQRVIFANPCKQLAHITYARANGVQMMTFDNETELDKIQRLHPEAKLVLRVVTDDSRSVCRFSQKFGVPMTGVEALLRAAQARHLDVIGISFHVGSGCYDEFAFVDAVRRARAAFDIGAALGYTFTLLDIGGGFPGSDTGKISFKQVAAVMAPEIDRLFPADVRVIAEPGRYFVTAAFTLLTSIHSIRSFQQKKKTPTEVAAKHDDGHAPAAATNKPSTDMFAALSNLNDGESNLSATLATGREETEQAYMYYINDGIYGAFNCIFFDHAHVTPKVVTQNRKFVVSADGSKALEQLPTYETAVYGPTCDGIDCIARGAQLPQLFVGDWLMFEEFGAYTCVAATNFNGMAKARIDFIELDH